jgi:YD repeat-containing protein
VAGRPLYGGGGAKTIIQTGPDGSTTTQVYQDGRAVSVSRADSGSNPLGGVVYGYDAHGRQVTITDARTGVTTYAFDDADRVESVTTPAPATGENAQTTTRHYNNMGQVWKTVQPDAGEVLAEFHLTGELKKTYGSRTYPVEYTYDYSGRMKTMKTWQNFANDAGAATTTWDYDTQRGWMSAKRYHDDQGPVYTYTLAGRLATRAWARGVVTTYGYNHAGQLESTSYSDTTPPVTQGYDRRGLAVWGQVGSGTPIYLTMSS